MMIDDRWASPEKSGRAKQSPEAQKKFNEKTVAILKPTQGFLSLEALPS